MPESFENAFKKILYNPIGVLGICLVGPLVEEAVCRGAIERRLLEKNWNPWFAIVLSALFFAVLHFNLAQGIKSLGIGIILGWVYYRTRSIWPCVLIHAINNTMLNLIVIVLPEPLLEKAENPALWISIPLMIVGIILLFFAIKQIALLTKDRIPVPVPVTSDSQPELSSPLQSHDSKNVNQ